MTIKQVQELYYIAESTDISIDKSIKMVGVVTGLTPEKVEDMKMDKFNKVCRLIKKQFDVFSTKLERGKPLNYIHVNGRTYRLVYDITNPKMNAGKYVEAATFSSDVINNLHKIMATMAIPVKRKWFKFEPYEREHKDIAADMEAVNFEAAYHAAVFFYTHYRVSMQLIHPYLVKQLVKEGAKEMEVEAILKDSLTVLDGFTMPRWSLNMREYLLNRYGN